MAREEQPEDEQDNAEADDVAHGLQLSGIEGSLRLFFWNNRR
jgi:hypothetical protein